MSNCSACATFWEATSSVTTLPDADCSVHHTFWEAVASGPALLDADEEDPLLNINESTVPVHLRPHHDPRELNPEEI